MNRMPMMLTALALTLSAACDIVDRFDPEQTTATSAVPAGGYAHDGAHHHAGTDGPSASITHFSEHTELFVEFPLLSVGNESPFAAHLTWLDNFRPVASGKLRAILRGGGLPEETFAVDAPAVAGIFRPVVVPAHAGRRELLLVLESEERSSTHTLGIHTVYPDKQAIPAAEIPDDDGAITYLKEQQWQVDFATEPVALRTLRESVRAVAHINAAADGEAEVSAPHDGQLARRGKSFPSVGTVVRKGQVLAVIGSPLGRELATSDRVSGTALRAPVAGIITHVHATAGSYLEKGQPVFHIVDPQRLWLECRIPEAELVRLHSADGAWLDLPGLDRPLVITSRGEQANGRVVTLGRAVDPRTRTAALILEFANPDQRLPTGMLVEAHVFTGRVAEAAAVPASAIVRDNGIPVVYVELGGESFERRLVRTGIRDGDYVEILSGVEPGERVVTRGAYLVKLAASGAAQAGHGHPH